jgi:hypothetical protein
MSAKLAGGHLFAVSMFPMSSPCRQRFEHSSTSKSRSLLVDEKPFGVCTCLLHTVNITSSTNIDKAKETALMIHYISRHRHNEN